MDRRSLIISGACLIAAPAIVRASSLMPVKPYWPYRKIGDLGDGFISMIPKRELEIYRTGNGYPKMVLHTNPNETDMCMATFAENKAAWDRHIDHFIKGLWRDG